MCGQVTSEGCTPWIPFRGSTHRESQTRGPLTDIIPFTEIRQTQSCIIFYLRVFVHHWPRGSQHLSSMDGNINMRLIDRIQCSMTQWKYQHDAAL